VLEDVEAQNAPSKHQVYQKIFHWLGSGFPWKGSSQAKMEPQLPDCGKRLPQMAFTGQSMRYGRGKE